MISKKTSLGTLGAASMAIALTGAVSCTSDPTPVPKGAAANVPTAVDPTKFLPFDPKDPAAKFTATLLVQNRKGEFPPTSITFGGQTFASDASGKIVIPNVPVKNVTGTALSATGYMSRSVLLQYQTSGGPAPLRVVLENATLEKSFKASNGAALQTGPMFVSLPPGSFTKADGTPFTGTVKAAAWGFDPTQEAISVGMNGIGMRRDFDIGRVQQGISMAEEVSGVLRFILPESIFQLDLRDDAGAPVKLKEDARATFKFHLSPLTKHKVGEVIPAYRFDTEHQRWKADSTCTVEANGSGFDCVGSTNHFSQWAMSTSGSSNGRACGNLRYRFASDPNHPSSITLPDGTQTNYPSSVRIHNVFGRDSETDNPGYAGVIPSLWSPSGTCFLQGQSYASVDIEFSAVRALPDGSVVRDWYLYRYGAQENANINRNLQLISGDPLYTHSLDTNPMDDTCYECPVNVIDIDPKTMTPYATDTLVSATPPPPPACAASTCATGSTCTEPNGTCVCPEGFVYKNDADGCVDSRCPSGGNWNYLSSMCVECALKTDATCDGIDDDCDGRIDDDVATESTPSTCGMGACQATGATICEAGRMVDSCTPGVPAANDDSCDGIDNNCNGVVDEGCPLVHKWDFIWRNGVDPLYGAIDRVGTTNTGVLNGNNMHSGRLINFGSSDYAQTGPIGAPLGERTIVTWFINMPNLDQSGGGVVALQDGVVFDGLSFGSRTAKQWTANSSAFLRTVIDNGGAAETVAPLAPGFMVSIAYHADGSIVLFRNDVQYGTQAGVSPLITYPATATVVFGVTNTLPSLPAAGTYSGNDPWFAGDIDEVQIYSKALNLEQIGQIYAKGPTIGL